MEWSGGPARLGSCQGECPDIQWLLLAFELDRVTRTVRPYNPPKASTPGAVKVPSTERALARPDKPVNAGASQRAAQGVTMPANVPFGA